MCPGECKDRMGDAFARFGRVPILRRTRVASPDDPAFRRRSPAPFWAAGGLVHDRRGSIVLVRVTKESTTGRWFTPGGLLEPGERTDDGLRREVREEVGVEVIDPVLTRIIQRAVSAGVIRDDFTFEDFGMVMCGITSTMYYKPGSADWRRHLAIILHGAHAPVRDVEPQSA